MLGNHWAIFWEPAGVHLGGQQIICEASKLIRFVDIWLQKTETNRQGSLQAIPSWQIQKIKSKIKIRVAQNVGKV